VTLSLGSVRSALASAFVLLLASEAAAASASPAASSTAPASAVAGVAPIATPVCPPVAQQSNGPDVVARVLAVFGLCVAGGGLFYTWRKDQRARKASIEDDFWFRKVVSPAAIEPIFATVTELLCELPEPGAVPEALRSFSVKVTKSLLKLSGGLHLLGMLSNALPAQVRKHVDACEDLIIGYLDSITRPVTDADDATRESAPVTPTEVSEKTWAALQAALQLIRAAHLAQHS
jgi:hypothetical protein